jgi:hypothetical protein
MFFCPLFGILIMFSCQRGGRLMSSQAPFIREDENKENEFIDFIVAAGVSGGLFFAIFIVAMIIELVM